LALILQGCVAASAEVEALYVPPDRYRAMSRAAIEQEGRQVAATAIAVSGVEVMRRKSPPENNENNLPIVWPALFFVNGNGINVDEFARLRGEFNTLEAVSAEKKCSLVFQAP